MELQQLLGNKEVSQIDWISFSGDGGSCKKDGVEGLDYSKTRTAKYVLVQFKDGTQLDIRGFYTNNKPNYTLRNVIQQ